MATLYLVSTPIGNLADITERAREVLGGSRRILAEDTRRTSILLRHLGVDRPLVSLHAHNEAERVERILRWMEDGESIALVSDAGTPLVSDPGSRLVSAVAEAGHDVVPVPGASAVLAALVGSGLPTDRFAFLGFLARRGADRDTALDRVAVSEETVILFESPERVGGLLEDLVERCGPERRVAVGRELTKVHEEFFRGTLWEALCYYEGSVRGEITVVVEPAAEDGGPDAVDEAAARALTRALLAEGTRPSRAAREVARRLGIPRNLAYELVQDEHEESR